jgi:hypothetical protein
MRKPISNTAVQENTKSSSFGTFCHYDPRSLSASIVVLLGNVVQVIHRGPGFTFVEKIRDVYFWLEISKNEVDFRKKLQDV